MPLFNRTRPAGTQDSRVYGLGEGPPSGVSPSTVKVREALKRIKFSVNDDGSSPLVCKINPVLYEPVDKAYKETLEVLHGRNIHQIKSFDGRSRYMLWRNIPIDNRIISDIVDYFRPKEGSLIYVNFGQIDSINNRWPSSETWKKSRIISIEPVIAGGGQLVYSTVKLMVRPEQ